MKQALQRSLKSPDAILSMIIGLGVVLAIGLAVINSIKISNVKKQEEIKKAEEQKKLDESKLPKEHTVKDGENLWVLSETYYKTGYNWVDISEANTLPDPDYITVDQKLTIPDVKPRFIEGEITATAAATSAPKHSTYTVAAGDTLWDISLKEYETNGRWPEIAATNKLPNPDLIYPDTILQLPR
jgi:nucleoid-associated protein YgaU